MSCCWVELPAFEPSVIFFWMSPRRSEIAVAPALLSLVLLVALLRDKEAHAFDELIHNLYRSGGKEAGQSDATTAKAGKTTAAKSKPKRNK